jgi:hypothetical protein
MAWEPGARARFDRMVARIGKLTIKMTCPLLGSCRSLIGKVQCIFMSVDFGQFFLKFLALGTKIILFLHGFYTVTVPHI